MIIGITGKSGVGKSTYARELQSQSGYTLITVDEICHKVLNDPSVTPVLLSIFGDEVIKNDEVDRKYLGDLVFENRHKYDGLTRLVWNKVKSYIDEIIKSEENIIIEWILLPHTNYWGICDKRILITTDESVRKSRAMSRDNISLEYLDKRDKAGIDYTYLHFDEVISL